MIWIDLVDEEQLATIKEESKKVPQLIFKHSTRCTISIVAKTRLEKAIQPTGVEFYYLDLLKHRTISTKIADEFSVFHESPQVLLIRNGKCVYNESHYAITMEGIEEGMNKG